MLKGRENGAAYSHLRLDVSEDGRLDEITAGGLDTLTSQSEGCTFFLPNVDVAEDLLKLHSVVLGALVR